jgi:putative ABC transport system ATP-binding protein/macrolide transport system ATP-binding/permease protein/lipoprotein-releasing system ATP-binding protein
MLKVENLGKRFSAERNVDAVSNVSLELESGQFLAVIGRSGSGKSTLLGMLGGISKPTSGSVIVDSVNQWSLNDDAHSDFRNRTIGFVFQFASLLPTLRAIDNVALPALIGGGLDYNEAYARAHTLLNHVGLSERFDSFPGQLSGGEQRRVAIARALINSPSVILADEPTADLDQDTEEEILNLLVDIHRAFKLTMVVVTHSNSIAERANQVLRMNQGRVVSVEQETRMTSTESNTAAPNIVPIDKNSRTASDSENQDRVEGIFNNTAELSAAEQVRLGEGVERLIGRLVLWIIPIILLVWGLNTGIVMYENSVLDAKENQRLELEELAMKGLRADIQNVTDGPGKTYIVTIYLRNTVGDKPIYVMAPVVRGFVQVGSSWQEVSMKAVNTAMPKVLKVTGNQLYKYILEPDVTGYAELLPYYMHVRISNDMLISPSDQPKTDLVERNDNYYVYLKPHNTDDATILKKMKFPGKPPVWIPMPPH